MRALCFRSIDAFWFAHLQLLVELNWAERSWAGTMCFILCDARYRFILIFSIDSKQNAVVDLYWFVTHGQQTREKNATDHRQLAFVRWSFFAYLLISLFISFSLSISFFLCLLSAEWAVARTLLSFDHFEIQLEWLNSNNNIYINTQRIAVALLTHKLTFRQSVLVKCIDDVESSHTIKIYTQFALPIQMN